MTFSRMNLVRVLIFLSTSLASLPAWSAIHLSCLVAGGPEHEEVSFPVDAVDYFSDTYTFSKMPGVRGIVIIDETAAVTQTQISLFDTVKQERLATAFSSTPLGAPVIQISLLIGDPVTGKSISLTCNQK